MLAVSIFAKRIESLDNIRNILSGEISKYAARGVPIEVNTVESGPYIQLAGQIPTEDGKVKVIEALYLSSSGDEAEEHPPIMIQQEAGKVRIIGQIYPVHIYEGVLVVREYEVDAGHMAATGGSLKVVLIGKDYVKLKDAIESAKQGQQAKKAQAQQYYI